MSLSEDLVRRIEEVVRPVGQAEPILSTTGTRAAVESLAVRTHMLEEAVRELAGLMQQIAESQRHD